MAVVRNMAASTLAQAWLRASQREIIFQEAYPTNPEAATVRDDLLTDFLTSLDVYRMEAAL